MSRRKFRIPDIWRFIISIAICQLAGIIGSVFTAPAVPTWYAALKKPAFSPPNWLFGPVWITLYVLMGISLFLVWRKSVDIPAVKTGLTVFGVQLILNILWSAAFFGLKSPVAGLLFIIALWIAILVTILRFTRVSEFAAILLVPYIVWVSFAAILNLSLFLLNR
ncbi:TspO protein [candidate division WOR_3 bacterium SM23_42]|uniref:TspO protein n=1 Tax=candidate division WOR_3 bacterium SM23_42 TaxID=1703779 RepID=A0A0S8FPZ5_UNCW3|nr:MAG: TspO protein [candidate division WOR_3 bacterium SM23_42]